MKRILALLLCVALIGGALAGCGSGASSSASPSSGGGDTSADTSGSDLPVINFYHHFYQEDAVDAKAMRALYDEFAEMHKDEFIFNPIPVEGDPQAVYDIKTKAS